MIDPSLETYDSPLQEEPTLPSLRQFTMEGAPLERDQTLGSSPSRDFDQSARPLARLGFDGVSIFLEAFSLLFPMVSTPFTSFNSFPSYPTLSLAFRSGNIFPLLSNDTNPIHLLQLVPELSHFPLALLRDYYWLTTLYGPPRIIYVEPTY